MNARTSLTLFEIAQEYRHITDVMMDSGVDEQTLADTLEAEAWPLELKAQNCGFVIRNLAAAADAIKKAERDMAARRKAMEDRANYLLKRLQIAMEIAGVSELSCPHFAIKVKKNPPSVDVFEPGLLPAEFLRQPAPPPAEPDKEAIAQALKDGQDVPGARMVQGKRLEIK